MVCAKHFPDGLTDSLRPCIPHCDIDRATRPTLDTGIPKVFRLAIMVLYERAWATCIHAQRDLPHIVEGTRNRVRAEMEAQQIGIPSHSIAECDSRNNEADLADLMGCICDGDRPIGLCAEELDL